MYVKLFWQNSFNYENCNIKFTLNTSDQITISEVSFETYTSFILHHTLSVTVIYIYTKGFITVHTKLSLQCMHIYIYIYLHINLYMADRQFLFGLVVKVPDSQSKGPLFKTTG